jgi:cytochrome c556
MQIHNRFRYPWRYPLPKLLFVACTIAGYLFASPPLLAENKTVSIKAYMHSQVIPASDRLFAVANQAPETDAEWQQLKTAVLNLQTAGKWLKKHASAQNQQQWRQFATDLHGAAAKIIPAVNSKTIDAITDGADLVYAVCENCHKQFLHPTTP